ncbi:MAG TPA: replication-relaxation family protein [Acidimicrobiales bacterium]|nr:replication-relaxation family protein [Acidimicrobiales bacterium]
MGRQRHRGDEGARPGGRPCSCWPGARPGRPGLRHRGLLFEQRVMTTAQLTAVAYGGRSSRRHRLVVLERRDVDGRFRPTVLQGDGSAPLHYVLGPTGLCAQRS